MELRNIPDVLGMKLPAAAALLDKAGLAHTENILRPEGRFAKTEGLPRVVRQKIGSGGTVILDICNIEEPFDE